MKILLSIALLSISLSSQADFIIQQRVAPISEESLAEVSVTPDICGGYYNTFKLNSDGTLWSVGGNINGQLGLGDNTDRHEFTQSQESVASVFCQFRSAAIIKTDGTLWVTGDNEHGALGLGNNTSVNTWTQSTLTDVKSIAGGYQFKYALKNDGTLWSVGRNVNGQLANGTTGNSNSWTQVESGVDEVFSGQHFGAIMKGGSLYMVGENADGQLGLGHTTHQSNWQLSATGVTDFAAGYSFAMIRKGNDFYSVGQNNFGQQANGSYDDNLSWQFSSSNVTHIGANQYTAYKIQGGTLYAAGSGSTGEIGDGTNYYSTNYWKNIATNTKATHQGFSRFLLLEKSDGSFWFTGNNAKGQAGLGYAGDNSSSNYIFTLTPVTLP